MKFRPCIDIHNGKVKQIVGGSLLDQGDQAVENFAADQEADYFANLYKKDGLKGGHVILLNPSTSEYYPETKRQALKALQTYQDGLQIGGGITAENAEEYMKAGASHVIVTSYVFKNGEIYWDNLQNLCDAVGKEHVVLDLSCRKKDEKYYIVTDRWQTFTNVELNTDILEKLSGYCDEFLVHGVDVEGKASGIEEELIKTRAAGADNDGAPGKVRCELREFSGRGAPQKKEEGRRYHPDLGNHPRGRSGRSERLKRSRNREAERA
jgi:phosphoribosylformimino-5-aminoimidazole carboxamide ribotide isomerase